MIPETKTRPVYPEQARADKQQGDVILQAVVRADGTIGPIRVLKEEPGDYGFADSARAAVSQWRYQPARLDGEPVDVYFTVVVRFALQ